MRSESSAIWTSGDPVSLVARWNWVTTPVFFSVARDILNWILQSEFITWIFGREYYRKGPAKPRLTWTFARSTGAAAASHPAAARQGPEKPFRGHTDRSGARVLPA